MNAPGTKPCSCKRPLRMLAKTWRDPVGEDLGRAWRCMRCSATWYEYLGLPIDRAFPPEATLQTRPLP